MKTVNEIKHVYEQWQREDICTDDMIVTIAEALIGITDHLEAQAKPCAGVQIGKFMDDGLRAEVRREAMIDALQWAARVTASRGVEYGAFTAAIARLENGGEL